MDSSIVDAGVTEGVLLVGTFPKCRRFVTPVEFLQLESRRHQSTGRNGVSAQRKRDVHEMLMFLITRLTNEWRQ